MIRMINGTCLAPLSAVVWVLLNHILADEVLSEMIAPHPSASLVARRTRAMGCSQCSIPIHNLEELKEPVYE